MRRIIRPVPVLILVAWVAVMAILVNRSYVQATGNLATDLARYGSSAQWRGVYYRGEKIGFTVSQTVPVEDGFELQEDGQLQMALLGAHTITTLRTTARVNRAFELQSFDFALDPGTGPIKIGGVVRDLDLHISITSGGSSRTEVRRLAERPMLSLNLVRRLADNGLTTGSTHQWNVFDPATLRNAPVTVTIGEREVVRSANAPIPAFRVEMEFSGLRTTAWITDTGEIVREESPLGFITVREPPERARALAIDGRIRRDLLEAAAVVPAIAPRTPPLPPIDDPRHVRRLRMRVEGADLSSSELQGAGQRIDGDIVEIVDAQKLRAGPADTNLAPFLAPEALIESDDPEIRAAAEGAVRDATGTRARVEALTRFVNSTVQKKPTVSIPSAREVLRTRIGDCNEHTALFVAMSRSIGIPARIAVGLAYVRGAFYYHAWPEVYIEESATRGFWLPVDPTFNQFPADATHVRLARGGLDKQAAIIPLIGRVKMTILDVEVVADSTAVLVGRTEPSAGAPLPLPLPRRSAERAGGWCLPCFLGGHE
ncbi:MAG TPA: transglutaminase-like domain-containing protein [Vicinamibacterales bacterium]|nr:transglutaminase-like domain-containing protein [Vicinamibacterales bacterium]